jgi:hypothetical protein
MRHHDEPSLTNSTPDTPPPPSAPGTRRRPGLRAALVAGTVGLGLLAGATLGAPISLGAQGVPSAGTDDTEVSEPGGERGTHPRGEALRERRLAWIDEALAPLVADGTLDDGQRQAVLDAVDAALPEPGEMRPGAWPRPDGPLVEVLGMDPDEIAEALRAGTTPAELAASQGIGRDELVDTLVAATTERIETARAEGRLSDEHAERMQERVAERIGAWVDGEGRRAEWFHPRGHRPFGDRFPGMDQAPSDD